MVAGVSYYATDDDQQQLLDYLGEPTGVTLHPWPVMQDPLERLDRREALASTYVMVVNPSLGLPASDRAGAPASPGSVVFSHVNRERLNLGDDDALVDSNRSPVLLWRPAAQGDGVLFPGNIGSQAESMDAVSPEFARWVNRVTGWVRRKGTRVWGLERRAVRPDLDVYVPHVGTIHALPGALAALGNGARGRG